MLSGQTQFHTFGLSCKVQGFILQVTYLQMNMWHTMTVIILHRVITTGSPKFHGAKFLGIRFKYLVHICCWIVPIVLTTVMTAMDDTIYHTNIWGVCEGMPASDPWSDQAVEAGTEDALGGSQIPRTCQDLFDYSTGYYGDGREAAKLGPDDPDVIDVNSYCSRPGSQDVPDGEEFLGETQPVSTEGCRYVPSELNGVGWCSIHSSHRVYKAAFFNLPQLVVVSFYAQYYYYIHQIVDPDKVGDVSGALSATKISTSARAGMMSTAEARRQAAAEKAAEQQRLYMLVYMMSFLVNTLMQLFGDNMVDGNISEFNLTIQALLVTPQGLFIGLIYMRTNKNLISAYLDSFANFLAARNPEKAASWKEKKMKLQMKREKIDAALAEKKKNAKTTNRGKSIVPQMKNILWVTWNVALMVPVAVWVWTPMEFLKEFLDSRGQMVIGLIVWGFTLVFPFYFFSVGRMHETDCLENYVALTNPGHCVRVEADGTCLESNQTCEGWYYWTAQFNVVFIILVAGYAVYRNRFAHHLLFTEGPIRRQGFLSRVGMGMRLNSLRNVMGLYTGALEFFQIWGLTWTATQMDTRYFGQSVQEQLQDKMSGGGDNSTAPVETDRNNGLGQDENITVSVDCDRNNIYNASAAIPYPDNATTLNDMIERKGFDETFACLLPRDNRPCAQGGGTCTDLLTFWMVVAAVGGWTFLYCLPHVINTTTVGNRQLSLNLMEKYRKYLWFMSGAGFLTILKALLKVQFCLPVGNFLQYQVDPPFEPGEGPLVSRTDADIACWGPTHLRMVAISLGCLCIFFPSASLTCLFRYDTDDDRGFGGTKDEKGNRVGGFTLGGEDLRWCHLWRRIEYIVKVCWVFMGYRLGEYGNLCALALFLGSGLIAFVNAKMEPSNLKYINRWKLMIHSSNVWTTITCLFASAVDLSLKWQHFMILVPGWLIIGGGLAWYENKLINADVFLLPAGDAQTISKCKKEARHQHRMIAFATGFDKWDTHMRIVRLLRLAEHPDSAVSQNAFETLATLAYMDQMTDAHSFFLCLIPTDPTTMTTFHAIMTSQENGVRNAAVQFMTVILQMNIGNRVAKPTTFHQEVMRYDDGGKDDDNPLGNALILPKHLPAREKNEIIISLCTYAASKIPRDHAFDAAALVLEMCLADSNKLIIVVDTMLPMLAEWMRTGNVLEQHLACHLVAMVSNRFDAAAKVIDSDCVEASIALFAAVYSSFGRFSASSTADSFVTTTGDEGQEMPEKIALPGRRLPKVLKREFVIPDLPEMNPKTDFAVDGDADDVVVQSEFELNKEQQIKLHGDILHYCVQIIVELAGASRAVGRRQLLEAGALTVIQNCLGVVPIFEERGLFEMFPVTGKGSELARVKADLMHEACNASHGFLAGRFGLHDMELDPDFDKPHRALRAWKEEMTQDRDWTATREFAGLTPIQRRKVHIVCAFLQLDHNSIGGIGDRTVVAAMKDPDAPPPEQSKAAAMAEKGKSMLGAIKGAVKEKVQPSWMSDPEDDIYKWCWKQMCDAEGAPGTPGIQDQMIELFDGDDPTVRFTHFCHLPQPPLTVCAVGS